MLSPRLTRRQRQLAALYRGQGLPRAAGSAVRVAVVGAGLAGLSAAYVLQRAGLAPALFEAAGRVGGRVRTEAGADGSAQVWELGGEFIDSQHDDMHALCDCLGIDLLDTELPGAARLAPAYRFQQRSHDDAQVLAAYAQIAPRIAADVAAISRRPGCRAPTATDVRFDRMPLAEYLAGLQTETWLQRLIEVAFVTLYGLDAGEQSALNLLTMIGTDTGNGLALFGRSDERYKVRHGSARLVDRLADALQSRLFLDRRLLRLRRSANDWVLTLAGDGAAVDVRADAVILALPFTLLRQVELDLVLPPRQRLAIDTLGYGTNSKLLFGMRRAIWREQGMTGSAYTDTALQTSWDCSRLRDDAGAVFTVYLGGGAARAAGSGDAADQGRRFARLAEPLFPGFGQQWTGEVRRAQWPSEPFALGSYTCYRPGQWTTFGGVEGAPVPGGLYFAGEHCATTSQGYMNGAVETGRRAATALLRRCRAT